MDFTFIRHGHGEHLNDYPNRLNTLHPSLTEYGKFQVTQLRNEIKMDPDDLVLVSPTKRTIETATIIKNGMDFIISPLVGPRMFPQNPELPFLACDHILSKTELPICMEILKFLISIWIAGKKGSIGSNRIFSKDMLRGC
ncbi:phosphoglycerate mutase family protein [Bacillus sp. FSL K6-6540]|uniref:phosphoglycerate mutase family protein n=1 Tax=Bacillus sp. FSL K6-6540 TaxID=2921512 RepID=UPI0030FA2A42